MGAFIAAIAIFLLVLLLILWRPHWGVGWIGLGGVFLTLGLGIADLPDFWQAGTVLLPAWVSIFSLLLIARILEAAGFFGLLAPVIIFLGVGRGRWLFGVIIAVAAGVSAFFSNYGCVLFWTVAVVEALRRLRFPPQVTLTYMMGIGLMANGGSFLFPWSNPLNGVVINGLGLSVWRYLLVMIPVQVVIILLSWGVMTFYFDLCLPKTYRWRNRSVQVRDRVVCRWGFPILGILLLCFLFAKPPAVFIGLTALLTCAIAGRWYTLNSVPVFSVAKIFQQLPWQLLLLSISLYCLGITLGTTGLTYYLQQWLITLSGWGMTLAVMGTGFTAAFLSSFTHNTGTLVNYVTALQDGSNFSSRPVAEAMIYANLIGCVLGAKLSPIGSLATLLWLDVVKRNVQHLYWRQYVRVYVALVLPVLFFSLLFLALWIPWLYP